MDEILRVEDLEKQGLLNQSTPSLSEMTGDTYLQRKAFCTSDPCCKGRDKKNSWVRLHDRIEKNVPRSMSSCPDCAYVLFWETKRVRLQDGGKHVA